MNMKEAKKVQITEQICRQAQLMRKGGANQAQVAELLGINNSTVSRIEAAGFDFKTYTEQRKARREKEEARKSFGLEPDKKTILIIGGSLGARTMNESVLAHLEDIRRSNVQVIWQTGKYYSQSIAEELKKTDEVENMKVMDFIGSMDNAYAAADVVVSRAGASSISELCLLGKPCILVPSPNVAEDHQTKNAMALSTKDAAIFIADKDAKAQLIDVALKTVADDAKLKSLSENVKKLAFHDSADVIAEEVYKLAVEYKASSRAGQK